MIKTSTQLKALVRNKSNGDSTKSQMILRNYVMGRFLERVSLSKYREYFVLKGGAYIASIVGLEYRTTMDIDATLKKISLNEIKIQTMIEEIIHIRLDDNIFLSISNVSPIMGDLKYLGIRVVLKAEIDSIQVTLKIDLSTDDAITPKEIDYEYKMMFEDRSISILAYNIETVLAEKFETIISRGTVNSRMRDFYDIYVLSSSRNAIINDHFPLAIINTCNRRGSSMLLKDWKKILDEIEIDEGMIKLWSSYCRKYDFAQCISWDSVIQSVNELGKLLEKTIDKEA